MPHQANVERLVARYPVGADVEVSYDPAHADVAVLEPGFGFGNVIGVAAGLGLLAIGGLWLRAVLGAA
jgi:hypothetical protein